MQEDSCGKPLACAMEQRLKSISVYEPKDLSVPRQIERLQRQRTKRSGQNGPKLMQIHKGSGGMKGLEQLMNEMGYRKEHFWLEGHMLAFRGITPRRWHGVELYNTGDDDYHSNLRLSYQSERLTKSPSGKAILVHQRVHCYQVSYQKSSLLCPSAHAKP
jgi:hypothetical protein